MATIQTAIQLRDGFSGPLRHICNAVNITTSNMARMQSASHNAIDTASIQSARNELAQAEASFNRVEEEIRQANAQQQNLNNSMRNGTTHANGLLNVVRQIGGAKDNMPKIDTSKLGGASLPNSAVKDLGKTATGTGQTAANTAKMAKVLDATGDDIKYLRDVAEREVINRFTTAEVKVEMNNQNNINSNMDLDGVVDYLGNTLNEKLQVVADGTYT